MSSEWKTIPGYSRYEANKDGRIRSTAYKGGYKTQELKPASSKNNKYLKTTFISDEGIKHIKGVHTMIALTFIGAKPDGMEIDHIDGDPSNNNVDNLEYVTHSVNIQRAFDIGLSKGLKGEDNPNCKYTDEFVQEVREEVEQLKATKGKYWGRKEYAESKGLSINSLRHLIRLSTKERYIKDGI